MKSLIYLTAIAALVLYACTNANSTKNAATNGNLKLEYFESVPDTIDGCSGLFTDLKTDIKAGKFLFVSNLTEFAIIKIKGKEIYLAKDPDESKSISEDQHIEVFKGSGYKAILNEKIVESYDEGGLYEGTLEISGNGVQAVIKVHGESGC